MEYNVSGGSIPIWTIYVLSIIKRALHFGILITGEMVFLENVFIYVENIIIIFTQHVNKTYCPIDDDVNDDDWLKTSNNIQHNIK